MRIYVVSLIALLAAGCRHYVVLIPAPEARIVPVEPTAAVAEVAGIHITADGKAWDGHPHDLPGIVTPILIFVENHSGGPIRIRWQEFSLAGANGFRSYALPPFSIQRPGTLIASPWYPYSGFFIAPPYAPFYPYLTPWPGAFDYDYLYDGYYTYWSEPLPSRDMIDRALPQGVLGDKGAMQGFLYFQRVRWSAGEVNLKVDFVNASTQKSVGAVTIPFRVTKS